jgi:hypothetical protein
MTAFLGGGTYARVCRETGDEDLLQRWLATATPDVRRAFLAALLVVDGQASVTQIVAGWGRLSAGRIVPLDPSAELDVEPPVYVVARLCEHCRQPLPDWPGFGRPSSYHAECRPLAAALRRSQARAAARSNGGERPPESPEAAASAVARKVHRDVTAG